MLLRLRVHDGQAVEADAVHGGDFFGERNEAHGTFQVGQPFTGGQVHADQAAAIRQGGELGIRFPYSAGGQDDIAGEAGDFRAPGLADFDKGGLGGGKILLVGGFAVLIGALGNIVLRLQDFGAFEFRVRAVKGDFGAAEFQEGVAERSAVEDLAVGLDLGLPVGGGRAAGGEAEAGLGIGIDGDAGFGGGIRLGVGGGVGFGFIVLVTAGFAATGEGTGGQEGGEQEAGIGC